MIENKIPTGTIDLAFDDAQERSRILEKLQQVYEKNGYAPVVTPTMEYASTFTRTGSLIAEDALFRQLDQDGNLLVLRPDNTMPIARLYATRLQGLPLPLKLSYAQPVFRRDRTQNGKRIEFMQSGIECIGEDGTASDASILQIAVDCFLALDLPNFKLEIGHTGIFYALVEGTPFTADDIEHFRSSIETKNQAALLKALLPYRAKCPDVCKALALLPTLFGSAELLVRAKEVFSFNEKALEILESLSLLLTEVEKRGFLQYVILDLGLVQHIDYYTGMVFQGYLPGIGEAALSGGRYNELTGTFGAPGPAAGFACTVDVLQKGSKTAENTVPSETKPLRLALTKGRLEKETVRILDSIGYDCSVFSDKGRKLIFPIPALGEAVLAKAVDVITYVERGVCDIGVVGKDTILENGNSFYEVLDLQFGKCRFAVAGLDKDALYSGYEGKKIATKYPKIAKEYFLKKGMDVEIIKIEGSVELAPLLQLADAIVDIVETGSTLKENGLVIYDEICDVSARLIINTAAMKLRKDEIELFLQKLTSAVPII